MDFHLHVKNILFRHKNKWIYNMFEEREKIILVLESTIKKKKNAEKHYFKIGSTNLYFTVD